MIERLYKHGKTLNELHRIADESHEGVSDLERLRQWQVKRLNQLSAEIDSLKGELRRCGYSTSQKVRP